MAPNISTAQTFGDKGDNCPYTINAKAKMIRYTRRMSADHNTNRKETLKERFSRIWRSTASKLGVQQLIERKVFENICFNSDYGLPKFEDMLGWCPSGAAMIRNLTFEVNYLHEGEPDEDIRNGHSFTYDLDALILVLHNHQAAQQNMNDLNFVLTTERWNRDTHLVSEDTSQPLRYMSDTVPHALDFVSRIEVRGDIEPRSILKIISSFPALEKCALKLEDHGPRQPEGLSWRDEMAIDLFGDDLFPSVNHLDVEIANTGPHWRNNNGLHPLKENDGDMLVGRLREVSTRCSSVSIVCPRITSYILWPTQTNVLLPYIQLPHWRYLEEIRIHFEPMATENRAIEWSELLSLSELLNPVFAAAGRAAQRMRRLRYMKISVRLGQATEYYLQLKANGPHSNVELSIRVPKHTSIYEVDNEVMGAWAIPSKRHLWPCASGPGQVDYIFEMPNTPAHEFF